MRKFGLKSPTEAQVRENNIMSKASDKTKEEKALEAKIRELESNLEYEKLRTTALNKLIDVAERDLQISIRKKHGTKQ
jgi:hypothetical protein